MNSDLASAFARLTPRRVHGIAAVLLPYTDRGDVDWVGFERHVVRTRQAGLDCAVNMDTGFGDLLSFDERRDVLAATRRALGDGVRFYAGAFTEAGGDPLAGYARSVAEIDAHGATPVIVQCRAMHGMNATEKAGLYERVAKSRGGRARSLSNSRPRFAPHGEIWDSETFTSLARRSRRIAGCQALVSRPRASNSHA